MEELLVFKVKLVLLETVKASSMGTSGNVTQVHLCRNNALPRVSRELERNSGPREHHRLGTWLSEERKKYKDGGMSRDKGGRMQQQTHLLLPEARIELVGTAKCTRHSPSAHNIKGSAGLTGSAREQQVSSQFQRTEKMAR